MGRRAGLSFKLFISFHSTPSCMHVGTVLVTYLNVIDQRKQFDSERAVLCYAVLCWVGFN